MGFRYQYEDGSILEFSKEPTVKELEQAGINAGAIQPTLRQKFDNRLMGGFQSLMKAPVGLMQTFIGAKAALNPFKTLEDYRQEAEDSYQKTGIDARHFVPGTPEAKTFQETFIQPQNKYQAQGQLAGDIGQFFLEAPVTGITKTQRLLVAPLIDTALQVSQDVGGGQSTPKEILRNAMLTAGTSILAGVFMPTKNINWMKMAASGALTGYVSDVATGLSGMRGEDRTGLQSLIPGAGTALGTAVGVGTGGLARFSSAGREAKITDTRYKSVQQLEHNYPTVRRAFDNAREQGYDPVNILVHTDALNGSTDAGGKISMGRAMNRLDLEMEPMEPYVYNKLKEDGTTITVKQYAKGLTEILQTSRLQMDERVALQTKIAKLIEVGKEIAKQNGGVIPLYKLQARKTSLGAQIRTQYGTVRGSTNKEVVRAYKEIIEKFSPNMDVKAYNQILQQLYTFRAVLKSLDGKIVEGGRLGRWVQTALGSYIGGQVGGPVGAALGAEIGFRGKSAANLSHFGKKNTPFVKGEFEKAKKKTAQSENIRGKRTTAQTKNNIQPKTSISKTIPQKKGLVTRAVESVKKSLKNPSVGLAIKNVGDDATTLNRATKYLREAKGLSASDIMKKHPDIQLKRDVTVSDIHGNKKVIPEGEALTPYELKGGKVLLQDGQTYVVSKNQYQNVKGQSVSGEAKEFAPELKGTEEVTLGHSLAYKNKQSIYFDDPRWGEGKIEIIAQDLEQRGFGNGEFSVWEGEKKIGDSMQYDEAVQFAKDHIDNSYPNARVDLSGLKEDVKPLNTKYSQYTLPGGENYKEILIKAPNPADIRYNKELDAWQVFEKGKERARGTFPTKRGAEEWMDENGLGGRRNAFISNHWDLERDVLAHLRMNWRKYKGKAVAFLEELQSDWAREGRSKGFIKDVPKPKLPEGMRMTNNGDTWKVVGKDGKMVPNKLTGEGGAYGGTENIALAKAVGDDSFITAINGIPNHPLLKNWQELSIKRALKEAVDSNAEYFAWINGEQTSARYNLATYVDDVKWSSPEYSPYKRVEINAKEGKSWDVNVKDDGTIAEGGAVPSDWKGKKLDEVLGKGLADSIMAKESGTLSGEGLKFGGEWANNLYDKQVGNIVSDLTGAKVEKLDLGLPIGGEKTPTFSFVKDGYMEPLLKTKIQRGLSIKDDTNGARYLITKDLGNGKFEAVPQHYFEDDALMQYVMNTESAYKKAVKKGYIDESVDTDMGELVNKLRKDPEFMVPFQQEQIQFVETFNITPPKNAVQQGIRLTPEIKAIIRGESPITKKPQQPPLEEFLAVRNRALNE